MSKIFPTCNEAARRLSEQLDAPLSGPTRFGLRLHLALCAHCRRYSRQIKSLKSFITQYPDHLSQAKLSDHKRDEIVRKLMGQP